MGRGARCPALPRFHVTLHCPLPGPTVSEVGPTASSYRDLSELGAAPWDGGSTIEARPKGDLPGTAPPRLFPAPWTATGESKTPPTS